MFPSLRLGAWFGIPVFVHATFWFLPLLALWSLRDANAGLLELGYYLVLLAAVFACVVLHEFGHALAARRFGIRTRDITLYPIGGVASLERLSEKPKEELLIAIAGPAVNVAIAAALSLPLVAVHALQLSGIAGTLLREFLGDLLTVNVAMILFNMIPAFPLDGGRVLRALLALKFSFVEATRWAVSVGTALAIVLPLAMLALWPQHASPMLIVIAFVLITSGQRELAELVYRERMRDLPPLYRRDDASDCKPRPAVSVFVLDRETGQWVKQG